MPTVAPVPQKTYTLPPAGTHVARIYKFINLGTRIQNWKGQPKDYPDTLVEFTLELPNELNEFEVEENGEKKTIQKPFVISREFTLSMSHKGHLRPFVEGIIGAQLTDAEAGAFDIEQLVGMTCLATIVHTKSKDGERTYANISTVAPLMKGTEAPAPVNEPVFMDVKTMTLDEFNALPDFKQKKIKISDEWKARFDPDEIERKKKLQQEIDARKPQSADSEEIGPEDIPF